MGDVQEILKLAAVQPASRAQHHFLVALRGTADLIAVHGLNAVEANQAFEIILSMLNDGQFGPFEAYVGEVARSLGDVE